MVNGCRFTSEFNLLPSLSLSLSLPCVVFSQTLSFTTVLSLLSLFLLLLGKKSGFSLEEENSVLSPTPSKQFEAADYEEGAWDDAARR